MLSGLVDLEQCPVKPLNALGFDPSYYFCTSENIMVLTFNTGVLTALYRHKHTLSCSVFSTFYHGKLTVDELMIQIRFILFFWDPKR